MRIGSGQVRATAAVIGSSLAVLACGSTHRAALRNGTPGAASSSGAAMLQAPPISADALQRGSPEQRIATTIVAFYRAAWQDDVTRACALFSANGRAGFMHAAAVSFPQGVNRYSSCAHAMQIYNATLGDSATNAQASDPQINPSVLNRVGVADVRIHGAQATAIAPMNVAQLINPKRIFLVRRGGMWLIDSSQSLNASNLTQILAHAKTGGGRRRATR